MDKATAIYKKLSALPSLAALSFVFLVASANYHLDAATTWQNEMPLPKSPIVAETKPLSPANDNNAINVLSMRDADLYRAAFAAQEKGDWISADNNLKQIKDKKLFGHVLADRYMRRPTTLAEAKEWMDSYAALPEAEALYDNARRLHGFAVAHIKRPLQMATWSGSRGYGASSGFKATVRTANGNEAASFFYKGNIVQARATAHKASSKGSSLGLWIEGLSAWKQKDYVGSERSFASLAQTPGLSSWDQSAASFWAYRAANRSGDKKEASYWLAESAKYPHSFYGAIATSMTGKRLNQSWKMPELTHQYVADIAATAAGWQALALVQVGRSDLAADELRLMPLHEHNMEMAALALAEKAHMAALSLQLAGVVTNDNGKLFDAAMYPVPAWQPTGGFKVDRALMYALMRHESQFDPDAVSSQGACGLMQIMPDTARRIDNNSGNGHHCSDRLFDPAVNMALGQKYVRVLSDEPAIGNNLLLLLAAYNGGPANLNHWLDNADRKDPLFFIESMPIRETRDYVQQVLLHYWMYRARLAEPETSVAQLGRGEWPRYALHDETAAQSGRAKALEIASR